MEHLILLEPGIENLRISETFVLGNETNLTFNDPSQGFHPVLPAACDRREGASGDHGPRWHADHASAGEDLDRRHL